MKKITTLLTSGILFLTINVSVKAEDFSYNYAQLTYNSIDYAIGSGATSIEGTGFGALGSFEVTPDLFISAAYDIYDMDGGLDLDIWEIGLGYHRAINAKTDLVAGLAMGNIEIAFLNLDTWSANAGVRHHLNNKIELGGKITYIDYDGFDSDTRFGANVLYKFKEDLSGIFALEFGDVDVISLGARFEF